jgi:hypothetical protein
MKFVWKKCYERHISSIHLQIENNKCEMGGTMFARKEYLRFTRKDTAEKPSEVTDF